MNLNSYNTVSLQWSANEQSWRVVYTDGVHGDSGLGSWKRKEESDWDE
jgi:hypothetical protein